MLKQARSPPPKHEAHSKGTTVTAVDIRKIKMELLVDRYHGEYKGAVRVDS